MLGLILTACLTPLAACRHRNESPALIVLVTIDTLRADHLPIHGYPRPTAPFLAELAARSVVFDHAYTASSHTGPAHASMLTSLHPFEHLLLRNGQAMRPGLLTLPELLRQHGYETAAFASVSFLAPLTQRFSHADARWRRGDATVAAAIDWLGHQPHEAPFFLWVHLFDVHQWQTVDLSYRPFEDELRRETTLSPADLHALLVETQRLDPSVQDGKGADLVQRIDRYDARIRYVDAELRRLFAAGEQWRQQRPALWIITADHGEGLGAHRYLGHGRHLYQEQLHVPLVVYSSDAQVPAKRRAELVHHVDLLPTVAEVAGIRSGLPADWRGRSLAPLLRAADTPWAPRLLFSQRRPADGGRELRWLLGDVLALYDLDHKFIYRTGAAPELYDLRNDPHEERNLIDTAGAVRKRFQAAIEPYASAVARQEDGRPVATIPPEQLEELRALGYVGGKQD